MSPLPFCWSIRVDRHSRGFDPEPRLISDTIPAFHNDNVKRVKHLGIDPLAGLRNVMSGIAIGCLNADVLQDSGHP